MISRNRFVRKKMVILSLNWLDQNPFLIQQMSHKQRLTIPYTQRNIKYSMTEIHNTPRIVMCRLIQNKVGDTFFWMFEWISHTQYNCITVVVADTRFVIIISRWIKKNSFLPLASENAFVSLVGTSGKTSEIGLGYLLSSPVSSLYRYTFEPLKK